MTRQLARLPKKRANAGWLGGWWLTLCVGIENWGMADFCGDTLVFFRKNRLNQVWHTSCVVFSQLDLRSTQSWFGNCGGTAFDAALTKKARNSDDTRERQSVMLSLHTFRQCACLGLDPARIASSFHKRQLNRTADGQSAAARNTDHWSCHRPPCQR